ncbi:membrane protein insertase YidC [Sporolactobacillus sp. THM7-4]|nr:membrane protein insertase YidC [Sporolactobacillus sp. THM7-4]
MNNLIAPFTSLIQFTASLFGNNYGLAIILITLFIRLVLAPLMMKQYIRSFELRKKMESVKPEMEEIQKRLQSESDPAQKQKIQLEMMSLYKKHNINPLSAVGCLPIVIQMPVLMGFYYAIRSSHEIASHTFLWFSLGRADIALTIIAGVVYYMQFKISQKVMPVTPAMGDSQQSMQWIGLISPVMIVFASLSTSAALPLYWVVGGLFLIVQTYVAGIIIRRMETGQTTAKQI